MKKRLLNEIRLTIIGWCFALALKIAPKNEEGLIIIETISQWATKSNDSLMKL